MTTTGDAVTFDTTVVLATVAGGGGGAGVSFFTVDLSVAVTVTVGRELESCLIADDSATEDMPQVGG